MSRKVVLHAGLPKTGTTALQAAFFHNRRLLAERGVAYPAAPQDDWRAERGRGTSGNGVSILDLLTGRGRPSGAERTETLDRIRSAAGAPGVETVLYSSEALFEFRRASLVKLRDALRSDGVALHVVVYVRDVAGHTVSAYAEHVKRRLYTGTLADYVGELPDFMGYTESFHRRLDDLLRILGPEQLHVHHYDSERAHLVETFFERDLGVACSPGLHVPDGDRNRTLTPHELALMRYANTRLSSRPAAKHIAEALVARGPATPGRLTVAPVELEILEEKFAPAVRWVNEHFFAGSARLTVAGGAPVDDGPAPVPELTAAELFLVDCLVDVVDSEALAEERIAAAGLRDQVRAVRRRNRRLRARLTAGDGDL